MLIVQKVVGLPESRNEKTSEETRNKPESHMLTSQVLAVTRQDLPISCLFCNLEARQVLRNPERTSVAGGSQSTSCLSISRAYVRT